MTIHTPLVDVASNLLAECKAWRAGLNHRTNMSKSKVGATYADHVAAAAAIKAANAPAPAFEPEAQHVAAVITAAQAMLDAFGGDVPDWLEREAATLQSTLGAYWAQRERAGA